MPCCVPSTLFILYGCYQAVLMVSVLPYSILGWISYSGREGESLQHELFNIQHFKTLTLSQPGILQVCRGPGVNE